MAGVGGAVAGSAQDVRHQPPGERRPCNLTKLTKTIKNIRFASTFVVQWYELPCGMHDIQGTSPLHHTCISLCSSPPLRLLGGFCRLPVFCGCWGACCSRDIAIRLFTVLDFFLLYKRGILDLVLELLMAGLQVPSESAQDTILISAIA